MPRSPLTRRSPFQTTRSPRQWDVFSEDNLPICLIENDVSGRSRIRVLYSSSVSHKQAAQVPSGERGQADWSMHQNAQTPAGQGKQEVYLEFSIRQW